jgi:hypothetical protein
MFGLSSPRFDLTRDQRGFVMSSPLALMSAGVVLLAGVGYFVTAPAKPTEVQLTAAPQQVEPQVTFERDRTLPVVRRGSTYVVVFNNSGVTGLAGRTSRRLAGAGWNVVGSDNWYGTIPSTTVYYPAKLKAQAQLLAEDLGVERLKPAIDPMQMDRLTVILTSDAH